jgi:hypothetical protein
MYHLSQNALLLLLFFSLKHPPYAKSIREGSIAPKRHVSQWVEQGGVCSFGKLLENLSEFRSGCFAHVQADGIALFWGSGGMQPVRCRNVNGTTDESGIDYFVLLLRWMLPFHGRVANLRESQLSPKACVVKCHRLSTICIEEKIGCEFHNKCDVSFPFEDVLTISWPRMFNFGSCFSSDGSILTE